ncbi:MAG: undecaprenyldiphospho-muramoylpentapeptide beta-N-acetylglucosaminyltransferase [Clostridia bacterium]|nr:undecaprenyldiphospho-muramoylpentapeptide beta-N-acetylglucosaminyltransferase [Clostridia bacterium]
MRVLMTGGGTGGHVYPALAIAEIIKRNVPDAEIAFVGTEKGIENRLVPAEGYCLHHIKIQGIRRSLSPANLKTAYLVLTSPKRAREIIRDFKPDLVIGTGGYVCWPLLRAASSMGIPSMVHESNALPGVAVRQLQGKVDVILTNFAETAQLLKAKDKIVHVGNPLRNGCGVLSREEARRKLKIPESIRFVVLSFGGSLGAQKLNEAAVGLMRSFGAEHDDVMHIHAGGARGYENARSLFSAYGLERNERLILKDYIYDMPLYMAAADLVICRAGAMTLTELAGMKKPAVLIPSPNVTDNHQYRNAKVLADAGAARLMEESEYTEEALCELVKELYGDETKRKCMSDRIAAFADADVERKIYEEICALLRRKKVIVPRER